MPDFMISPQGLITLLRPGYQQLLDWLVATEQDAQLRVEETSETGQPPLSAGGTLITIRDSEMNMAVNKRLVAADPVYIKIGNGRKRLHSKGVELVPPEHRPNLMCPCDVGP